MAKFTKKGATHLSRDIFKGFYVDKLLAVPKVKDSQEV